MPHPHSHSVSHTDSTPFGMQMRERSYDLTGMGYRYGFNQMEKDDELKGKGNSYDFGARLYDPRVGRWLSVDPLAKLFPNENPYLFGGDNPIIFVDKAGKVKTIFITVIDKNGHETTFAIVDDKYIEWAYDGDLGVAAFDVTYRYRIDLQAGQIQSSSPEYTVNINYNTVDWISEKILNIDKVTTGSGDSQKSGYYLVTDEGGSSPSKFTPIEGAQMTNITDLIATFGKGGSAATKPKNLIEALNFLLENFESGQSLVPPLENTNNTENDKVFAPDKPNWKQNVTNDSADIPLMNNDGKQIGTSRFPKDEKGKPDLKHLGKKYYNQ